MKKTLALVLALVMALCAMSVSVFAFSFNADFEDGSVGEWTTHGGPGNLSVVDGELLTSGRWNGAFKTACSLGTIPAGTYEVVLDIYADPSDMDIDGAITYTVHIVNGVDGNLDGTDYISENFVITSGTKETVSLVFVVESDWTDAFLAVNTIEHDPWARSPEFKIDNVVIAAADASEAPATEEAPAEEPAETGLALAVVPMIVAALAVVVSKKR